MKIEIVPAIHGLLHVNIFSQNDISLYSLRYFRYFLPVFSFLFVLLFKFFTSRVRRLAKQIEIAIEWVFSESSFSTELIINI